MSVSINKQINYHTIEGRFLLLCYTCQGFGGRVNFDQAQQQRYVLREQHTAELCCPLLYALCGLLWLHLQSNQKRALDGKKHGHPGMQ